MAACCVGLWSRQSLREELNSGAPPACSAHTLLLLLLLLLLLPGQLLAPTRPPTATVFRNTSRWVMVGAGLECSPQWQWNHQCPWLTTFGFAPDSSLGMQASSGSEHGAAT